MGEGPIRREELAAAVEARRELGPDYEDPVLDAFMEKLERRLDERVKRTPAEREPSAAAVPLASIGMGIPITAIAGGTGGVAGILIAWIGIVLVNVAYALARRR